MNIPNAHRMKIIVPVTIRIVDKTCAPTNNR